MTTFVLVHGASSTAWTFSRLAPLLRASGHTVVAPDLPIADEAAGFEEYVDAVVSAIGTRPPVVIVGASMGAFTAALVAGRVPTSLLVLLTPMIPAPGEGIGTWFATTGQRAAVEAYAAELGIDPAELDPSVDPRATFFHDLPADLVAEMLAAGAPVQAGGIFGAPYPLSRWPEVPTRVVAGRDDRMFPLPFVQRLSRERLGVEPDVVPAGHLAALGRPHEVATTLLRLAGEAGHG